MVVEPSTIVIPIVPTALESYGVDPVSAADVPATTAVESAVAVSVTVASFEKGVVTPPSVY
ncbi:MAG: hypothetical protein VKN13_03630 [Cyanobacteriota bacterium]|nr:hypothetical protein [Cyanobacteriota bacterium]